MLRRNLFILSLLLLLSAAALPASAQHTPDGLRILEVLIVVNGKVLEAQIVCSGTVPGIYLEKRARFISFAERIANLKRAARSKAKRVRKLKALKRQGASLCTDQSPAPTPTPLESPAPTLEPGETPAPTPEPGGQLFDLNGQVTPYGKEALGIPARLEASIAAGRNVHEQYCTGCHLERLNYTFPELRTGIAGEPMYYTEQDLPDSDLADITAFLNRARQ